MEDAPLTERHVGNSSRQHRRMGIVQGNHVGLGQQRRLHHIGHMLAIRQKDWKSVIGFSGRAPGERDWSAARGWHSKQTGGTGSEDNLAAIIPCAPAALLYGAQVYNGSSGNVNDP